MPAWRRDNRSRRQQHLVQLILHNYAASAAIAQSPNLFIETVFDSRHISLNISTVLIQTCLVFLDIVADAVESSVGSVLSGLILKGLDGLNIVVESDLNGTELRLDELNVETELFDVLFVLRHEFTNLVSHLDNSLDTLVQKRNFILYGLGKIVESAAWADVVVVNLNG
ncbi:hypothetical protein HG531_000533 [Fusarium graminearum]|nr:hypothetical protein HG531_000533 [Fusarium graminearum]